MKHDEKGSIALEYILVSLFAASAAIAALTVVKQSIQSKLDSFQEEISSDYSDL